LKIFARVRKGAFNFEDSLRLLEILRVDYMQCSQIPPSIQEKTSDTGYLIAVKYFIIVWYTKCHYVYTKPRQEDDVAFLSKCGISPQSKSNQSNINFVQLPDVIEPLYLLSFRTSISIRHYHLYRA
jgi:hypothetical protein